MISVYPLAFLGFWEIIVIVFVILLLFGAKKIPELMKGIGKGVKSFQEGMRDAEAEIKQDKQISEHSQSTENTQISENKQDEA